MLGYIDSAPHGLSSSRNVGGRAVGIHLAAGHLPGEKRPASFLRPRLRAMCSFHYLVAVALNKRVFVNTSLHHQKVFLFQILISPSDSLTL